MRNVSNYTTDAELVALLGHGDAEAFEAIYRRYALALYRYARKNISVSEDCEEIVQDVFLWIWSRRENLGHITTLKAYLFRMVTYQVIRYFQRNSRKRKYAEHYRLFEVVYDSINEEERDPALIQSVMGKGLALLPERCQQAVKLRLDEDLSNGEIAERMNIRKSTVENYMVMALSHLRALYQSMQTDRGTG